jgi:tRNA pseudouridine 55 synthase
VINGIINVYKEASYTSHDVVAKLRGILKQRKIGHTGTLDPDATGVLPVCLGKGTKLCDMLTDADKTYEAVLELGLITDTQDISGTVLKRREVNVTEEEVIKVIKGFVGEYMQIPPMFSALKVNGKKLYELAREGKEIERQARKVFFHKIEIMDITLPRVTLSVTCSKGTYIRTLCHDIGEQLKCGGCMQSLIRTRVGAFQIGDSRTLCEIEAIMDNGKLDDLVISVESMFQQYPAISTKPEYDSRLYNGNTFELQHIAGEVDNSAIKLRVYDSKGDFIGIYQYQEEKENFKLVKMFYER